MLKVTLGTAPGQPGIEPFLVTMQLTEAPHMLVAGMTGSGKSVFINSLLTQLITSYPPTELRLLLLDPKRVELAPYAGIPHLLNPPLWDPMDMDYALLWLNREMDERFTYMASEHRHNIYEWNRSSTPNWPWIVVVVDELANLVIDNKAVEQSLVRLATMGRAAGIHLILATQSPRADVLTGLIRANVPTRIAFATATAAESRIILEENGAEELPGKGTMLARIAGDRTLYRLQGANVTNEQIDVAVKGTLS